MEIELQKQIVILNYKMEIELQNKLWFWIANGNWIAKLIVIWNWNWKLNCITNGYFELKMEIELQNKLLFWIANGNWIAKQIVIWYCK
jgi:hypothetical protein